MGYDLLISFLIYLLIGMALSLFVSIANSKYETENKEAEKVPTRVYFFMVVIWPIWVLIFLVLAFTRKTNDGQ
jgi:ABC-type methionine transport system permease subunit